MDLGNLFLNVY